MLFEAELSEVAHYFLAVVELLAAPSVLVVAEKSQVVVASKACIHRTAAGTAAYVEFRAFGVLLA